MPTTPRIGEVERRRSQSRERIVITCQGWFGISRIVVIRVSFYSSFQKIERLGSAGCFKRQSKWSEAVCVGSAGFVEQLKHRRGAEVLGRNITQDSDAYILREPDVAYNAHFDTKKEVLSMDNGVCFDENEGGINRLAWSD